MITGVPIPPLAEPNRQRGGAFSTVDDAPLWDTSTRPRVKWVDVNEKLGTINLCQDLVERRDDIFRFHRHLVGQVKPTHQGPQVGPASWVKITESVGGSRDRKTTGILDMLVADVSTADTIAAL